MRRNTGKFYSLWLFLKTGKSTMPLKRFAPHCQMYFWYDSTFIWFMSEIIESFVYIITGQKTRSLDVFHSKFLFMFLYSDGLVLDIRCLLRALDCSVPYAFASCFWVKCHHAWWKSSWKSFPPTTEMNTLWINWAFYTEPKLKTHPYFNILLQEIFKKWDLFIVTQPKQSRLPAINHG